MLGLSLAGIAALRWAVLGLSCPLCDVAVWSWVHIVRSTLRHDQYALLNCPQVVEFDDTHTLDQSAAALQHCAEPCWNLSGRRGSIVLGRVGVKLSLV